MTLTHIQAQELIQKGFETRLDALEAEALRAHLKDCAECSAVQEEQAGLNATLARALPARWPEPGYTAAALNARLASIHQRTRRVVMFNKVSFGFRLAAGAVVFILALAAVVKLTGGLQPQPQPGGDLPPVLTSTAPADLPAALPTQANDVKIPVDYIAGSSREKIAEELFRAWLEGFKTDPGDPQAGLLDYTIEAVQISEGRKLCAEIHQADFIAAVVYSVLPLTNPPQRWNATGSWSAEDNWIREKPAEIAVRKVGPDYHMEILGIPDCPPDPSPTVPASPEGGVSLAEAEGRVRDFVFQQMPALNPDAVFPLEEITTPEVWERLGAQVFRVKDGVWLNEALFIKGADIWHPGTAFGGMGVTQVEVTDLNDNGQPELLYVYTFGSGISQARVGVLEFPADGAGEPLSAESDFTNLTLKKIDDQTVEVWGVTEGKMDSTLRGTLRWNADLLIVEPVEGEWQVYTDKTLRLAFFYPAGWQPSDLQADDPPSAVRYAGDDGFFLYTPGAYQGDLARACEVEVNLNPGGRYGQIPELMLASVGGREVCILRPAPNQPNRQAAVLIQSLNAEVGHALLLVDPQHLDQVTGTLSFQRGGDEPVEDLPAPMSAVPADPPMPQLTSQTLGALTLEEWAVVSADVDTPGRFEFRDRIPAVVFDRRANMRSLDPAGTITRNQAILETFGYRLAGEAGNMSLYRGDELVLDSLHVVYPASMYVDESGRGDFAMLVEQSGTARPLLVQNNRLETYEQLTYHFTLPVYAGERLITAESDPVTYNRLIVRQDGEPIFTYLTTGFEVGMPVKGLHAWNGSWVLEVNGTLIVDGVNWNQKELAADEIFGFQMLDGQPFFFFVRDGVTGLWYAGEELPVRYAEVIHYRCCEPAMFNQGGNERMVWFYARRDGMWYYTELGKFE